MSVPAGLRKRHAIPAWSMAAGIAIIFFGLVGYARLRAIGTQSSRSRFIFNLYRTRAGGVIHAGEPYSAQVIKELILQGRYMLVTIESDL